MKEVNRLKEYEKETGLKAYSGNIHFGYFQYTANFVEWLENKLQLAEKTINIQNKES